MDELVLEHRLTDLENKTSRNEGRIKHLEESTETMNRMATAIEVMAEKQDRVADSVDRLDSKVTALEAKPAKRWDNIVDKVIWAFVGAAILYVLGQIGL